MTVEVVKVAEDGWTVPLGKPRGIRIFITVRRSRLEETGEDEAKAAPEGD